MLVVKNYMKNTHEKVSEIKFYHKTYYVDVCLIISLV